MENTEEVFEFLDNDGTSINQDGSIRFRCCKCSITRSSDNANGFFSYLPIFRFTFFKISKKINKLRTITISSLSIPKNTNNNLHKNKQSRAATAYRSSEKLECYTVSLEKRIIKSQSVNVCILNLKLAGRHNKLFKQHFSLYYYEHQQHNLPKISVSMLSKFSIDDSKLCLVDLIYFRPEMTLEDSLSDSSSLDSFTTSTDCTSISSFFQHSSILIVTVY
ncbi:hypothetical protein BpHYR1_026789 [Brachionus plicatilis]|uniref:Uncharacterized protein n=1 Tax=Brachionus plicatilis TaxID=10195 RepID=A0A3M7QQ25_BRAPC|nr:hypothetical protein BpHYR1_026789 [Brachionus plicatilis]